MITPNFLLNCNTAEALYNDYAASMPIIDYHCHISPKEIAENRRFENLTQIWLEGDHYKWRALRACGVDEKYITGDAPDWEKFEKWAETVPKTLRNPLYHWSHMELKNPFRFEELLSGANAKDTWDFCNEKLAGDDFSCRGIIKHFDVRLICTTDDPIDSLDCHQVIKGDESFDVTVLPAWRPDKAMAVESQVEYNVYLDKLGEICDFEINSYEMLLEALKKRHDYFAENGCCVSDHGLQKMVVDEYTEHEVHDIFTLIRSGHELNPKQIGKLKSALLYDLAIMDYEKNWVQQFHLGAIRDLNTRMFKNLGPDTGFDAMGHFAHGTVLARFLDKLDISDQLAKTIVYNLNPIDNEMFGTIIGCFQDGSFAGKMQFGSGWWFNDQLDGMTRQINALSNMGLLSQFVGMLTDSRSFLSYSRHDYFRRLLCNILGMEIEKGLLPNDLELVGGMVRDICFNNANRYFEFNLTI